jgi:hypothetical protein
MEHKKQFHGSFDERAIGGRNSIGQGFQGCHNQNRYNHGFTGKETVGEYPKAIRLLTRIWNIEKGSILIQRKSLEQRNLAGEERNESKSKPIEKDQAVILYK